MELSGEAYKYSVYQGYENKEKKLSDAKEIDTENENNLYCILLRKEDSENLSQEKVTVENKDCFYLNYSGAKCRFCGNDELSYDDKSKQASVKNNKPLENDAFCVKVNNGTVQWYRIPKDKLKSRSKDDRTAILKAWKTLKVPELLLCPLPKDLANWLDTNASENWRLDKGARSKEVTRILLDAKRRSEEEL